MPRDPQPEFAFFPREAVSSDVEQMIRLLRGRDWVLAITLLVEMGRPANENERRLLRVAAAQSDGQIGSGQRGYKLVEEMTHDEYIRFRNTLTSQAGQLQARVLASDRVFYRRKGVTRDTGIVEPAANESAAEPTT